MAPPTANHDVAHCKPWRRPLGACVRAGGSKTEHRMSSTRAASEGVMLASCGDGARAATAYISLHTVTYRYIPLYTVTCRYMPLHTVTYRYRRSSCSRGCPHRRRPRSRRPSKPTSGRGREGGGGEGGGAGGEGGGAGREAARGGRRRGGRRREMGREAREVSRCHDGGDHTDDRDDAARGDDG